MVRQKLPKLSFAGSSPVTRSNTIIDEQASQANSYYRDLRDMQNKKFDTFIFDMDGTLLDTLPDLVVLTNKALGSVGFPLRTEAEILGYIGGGARALMEQAVPHDAEPGMVEHAFDTWKMLYPAYGFNLTREYSGITAVLQELQRNDIKLGLLSNKFDSAVRMLADRYFPDMFSVVHGESKEIPRKPDPTGLLRTIDELSSTPEKTVYVGDATGDVKTAHNAGTFALGVAWGYQGEEELVRANADAVIKTRTQILELFF